MQSVRWSMANSRSANSQISGLTMGTALINGAHAEVMTFNYDFLPFARKLELTDRHYKLMLKRNYTPGAYIILHLNIVKQSRTVAKSKTSTLLCGTPEEERVKVLEDFLFCFSRKCANCPYLKARLCFCLV